MNIKRIRDFALATVCAALPLLAAATADGQDLQITTQETAGAKYAGELTVPVDKSQIIRVDRPFSNLFVGNPEIADVRPLTNRSIYVLGKALGSTNLAIHGGPDNRPIAVVDLNVTHDIQEVKRRLFELTGGERIEVRSVRDSLVLSGMVSSAGVLDRVLAVAERYAPDKVTNLMSVAGSQQVMLAVRFAEMKRSAAKDLGINLAASFSPGNDLFTVFSGKGVNPELFGGLAGSLTSGIVALDAVIDALEEKGVVKTLAEPNLIALSGDTATFLAGGEFPIPVAQSNGTNGLVITVEFKEFGVSLAFTPTVLDDGLISMVVAPEVSSIDPTVSIELNNVTIPGLTTRRTKTTVELRDGQSFAIAGLIQSNFVNQIDQFPFVGDVPVLGALARSSDFRHEETELVIVVTPYLVKPANAGELALPTDTFLPPSDFDFFFRGRLESALAPVQGKASEGMGVQTAGGLDGTYGHILQ